MAIWQGILGSDSICFNQAGPSPNPHPFWETRPGLPIGVIRDRSGRQVLLQPSTNQSCPDAIILEAKNERHFNQSGLISSSVKNFIRANTAVDDQTSIDNSSGLAHQGYRRRSFMNQRKGQDEIVIFDFEEDSTVQASDS